MVALLTLFEYGWHLFLSECVVTSNIAADGLSTDLKVTVFRIIDA
jgi:hypothetical protein